MGHEPKAEKPGLHGHRKKEEQAPADAEAQKKQRSQEFCERHQAKNKGNQKPAGKIQERQKKEQKLQEIRQIEFWGLNERTLFKKEIKPKSTDNY